jgi:alpha/beta superfamily hydrolase
MNAKTQRLQLSGPAGPLECALDAPPPEQMSGHRTAGAPAGSGLALLCHPHPQFGGTMDNKVVQTMARALVQLGWRCVRFNFRGVGGSAGQWDEGRGEIDDALAVLRAVVQPGEAVTIGGFSFGAYVATHVTARWLAGEAAATQPLRQQVLVGPAVRNFQLADVPDRTLVIQGELDDVVPMAAVLDWARPIAMPVTVVPGAGHFFHGQLGVLKQCLLASCQPP